MSRRARPAGLLSVLAWVLFSSRAVADPFVVMSYNVENWVTIDRGLGHKKDAHPEPKPEAQKNAVVNVIAAHRPDILGVIEMGNRDDLEDLRSRLKIRGLDYPNTEWHEGIDPDRHVALLSRFPIVARNSQDKIPFGLGGQPEAVQRGILDVTIEPSPGYRLRILGLHLKSRLPSSSVDQQALRARESWFVRSYLDQILGRDPKTKLLLFGDLNTTKDDYPIRQILGPSGSPSHLTDLPLQDDQGERWTHYYVAADDYSRIDYFMVNATLKPGINAKKSGIDRSPDWNDASDHRAIFTTIDPK